MLCFRNAKETIFVSRVKYTFVPTRDCKSCSPARQLNLHIFVTSLNRDIFSFSIASYSADWTAVPAVPKIFFLQQTKSNRALFAARVVATVQMVAFRYKSSRLSVKKEMIKKH